MDELVKPYSGVTPSFLCLAWARERRWPTTITRRRIRNSTRPAASLWVLGAIQLVRAQRNQTERPEPHGSRPFLPGSLPIVAAGAVSCFCGLSIHEMLTSVARSGSARTFRGSLGSLMGGRFDDRTQILAVRFSLTDCHRLRR